MPLRAHDEVRWLLQVLEAAMLLQVPRAHRCYWRDRCSRRDGWWNRTDGANRAGSRSNGSNRRPGTYRTNRL